MIRKFHPDDLTTAICGIVDLRRHRSRSATQVTFRSSVIHGETLVWC